MNSDFANYGGNTCGGDDDGTHVHPPDYDPASSEYAVDDDYRNFQQIKRGLRTRRTHTFGEGSAVHITGSVNRKMKDTFEGGRRHSVIAHFDEIDDDEQDSQIEQTASTISSPAADDRLEDPAWVDSAGNAAQSTGPSLTYGERYDTQGHGDFQSYPQGHIYSHELRGPYVPQLQAWDASSSYAPYGNVQQYPPVVIQPIQYTYQSFHGSPGNEINQGYQNTQTLSTNHASHRNDTVDRLTSEERVQVQQHGNQAYQQRTRLPGQSFPKRTLNKHTKNWHKLNAKIREITGEDE